MAKQFSEREINLPRTMKSLDDKIAELRKEQSFRDVPLQELIRMDAVCLALRSLIDALKETEATARTIAH